ncbi:MAG: HPr family phosphocarrier protein [Pseudomonadales bacterium]|nr:HPr family phosphocarrier protein [Pseudomonadales bacterium]
MLEQDTTIKNRLGLHARAASKLVETCQRFGSAIEVIRDGQAANGKSIMSMLMLQATLGTPVTIRVEGEDEAEALQAVLSLIDDFFGEGG